jgi:hypothetical protein
VKDGREGPGEDWLLPQGFRGRSFIGLRRHAECLVAGQLAADATAEATGWADLAGEIWEIAATGADWAEAEGACSAPVESSWRF